MARIIKRKRKSSRQNIFSPFLIRPVPLAKKCRKFCLKNSDKNNDTAELPTSPEVCRINLLTSNREPKFSQLNPSEKVQFNSASSSSKSS